MPRGFLVKRSKKSSTTYASWRIRRNSEEDKTTSDSGSDHENNSPNVYTAFGSPDSGFSQSPLSLTFKDSMLHNVVHQRAADEGNNNYHKPTTNNSSTLVANNIINNNSNATVTTAFPPTPVKTETGMLMGSLPSTPSSSPLSIVPGYASPFYFSSFDRLSVSSPTGKLALSIRSPSQSSTASSNPASPSKKRIAESPAEPRVKTPKKPKAARKITFDEDKSSPVSGTFIKDFSDSEEEGAHVVCGDIEPSMNLIDISPEAKAELAKIENKIGDFLCMLCKECYTDAFTLAQHKCSRIVHVEYRCPECDKVFSCPANLASHRRWHKPRPNKNSAGQTKILPANPGSPNKDGVENDPDHSRHTPSPGALSVQSLQSDDGQFECETCGKKFKRQAYLRKHMANHNDDRTYPCQFCGKIFRAEAAKAKHMLQHAAAAGPPKDLTCHVCSNVLPNKATLDRHMRIHSSEVYTCKYCSSTFYSSPGLTRHINKCHPSENRQVILLQLPVNRPC